MSSSFRTGLRAVLLILSLAAAAAAPVYAADISLKIDKEAARRLAAEGFPYIRDLNDFHYDKQDKSFFIFAPLGGEDATAPVAWLGVNPWTGDVWDVWMCKKLSTPALRKSQAAIRKRFSREELKQYTKLRALKPVCYGP